MNIPFEPEMIKTAIKEWHGLLPAHQKEIVDQLYSQLTAANARLAEAAEIIENLGELAKSYTSTTDTYKMRIETMKRSSGWLESYRNKPKGEKMTLEQYFRECLEGIRDTPRCEHCGSDRLVDKCGRCGAPQCCDVCCQISTLQLQLQLERAKKNEDTGKH
jgi:hypothetical protein